MTGPVIIRTAIGVALAVLALAECATALPSQMLHPNRMRGIGGAPLEFTLDAIDRFNGNLRVEIPLGLAYPVTPRFSYRLVLTYNSNAWDLSPALSGGITASPLAQSNAGFGWDLSLGRLVAPGAAGNTTGGWVYVDPSGRPHPFHTRLHADVADEESNVFFSRDGDYLRLRKLSHGEVTVEHPDGLTRVFELDEVLNDWRLIRIEDLFGNSLSVVYESDRWVVSDTHGRVHRLFFGADPSGHYPRLVERIEVAAFGDTTATYHLSYGSAPASREAAGDTDPATADLVNVPLLESVTLPDGTSYGLDYEPAAGRLSGLTLPTLGRIEWTYRARSFQSSACLAGLLPQLLQNGKAVATRRTRRASGEVEGTWHFYSWLEGEAVAPGCAPYLTSRLVTPLGDESRHFFMVDTVSPAAKLYGLPIRTDAEVSPGQYLSQRVYDCDEQQQNCALVREIFEKYVQDPLGTAAGAPDRPLATYRNRRQVAKKTTFVDDPHPAGGYYYTEVKRSDFDGLGHFRTVELGGNFDEGDFLRHDTQYDSATGTYPGTGWSKPDASARWVLGKFSQSTVDDGHDKRVRDFCWDSVTGLLLRSRTRTSPLEELPQDVIVTYAYDEGGNVSDERHYGGDVQVIGTSSDLCSISLPAAPVYRIRKRWDYGVESRIWHGGADFSSLDRDIDQNTGLAKARRDVAGSQTDLEYDTLGRLEWEKPAGGNEAWLHYVRYAATGGGLEASARTERLSYANGEVGGTPLTRVITYQDAFGRRAGDQIQVDSSVTGLQLRFHDAQGNLASETEGRAVDEASARDRQVIYGDHDPFGRPRRVVRADGRVEILEYRGVRQQIRIVQRGYFRDYSDVVVEKDEVAMTTRDRQGRVIEVATARYAAPDWEGPPVTTATQYRYSVDGERTEVIEGGVPVSSAVYDGRGYVVSTEKRILPGLERVVQVFSRHDPLGLPREKATTLQRYAVPTPEDEVVQVEYAYDKAGRILKVWDSTAPHVVWREFRYGVQNVEDASGQIDFQKGRLVEASRQHWEHSAASSSLWRAYDTVRQVYKYAYSGRVIQNDTVLHGSFSGQPGVSYSQHYGHDPHGRLTDWSFVSNQGDSGYTLAYAYDGESLESVLGSVSGQLGGEDVEEWVVSRDSSPSGLPTRTVRGNGVIEILSGDGMAAHRPGRLQLQNMQRWDTDLGWSPYLWDSGSYQYDGVGRTVRRGERYYVPRVWDIVSSTAASQSSHPCWGGFVDAEDLRYSAWANEYCTVRDPIWSYDHRGYQIAGRDSRGWTYTIRDLQGRVVWRKGPFVEETSAGTTRSGEFQTFVVHGPTGARLGELQRRIFQEDGGGTLDEVTVRYHHPRSLVETNEDGKWINDAGN